MRCDLQNHLLKRHGWGTGVRVLLWPDHFILLRESRQGYVYGGCLLPFTTRTASEQRMEIAVAVWEGKGMKKKDTSKVSGGLVHASPDLLKPQWPNLAEWLTAARYDDGQARESPTLTIWAQGGLWKVSLRDRAEKLVMWLTAEKLLEVLAIAESLCLTEDGPWRVDDVRSEFNGKRKKN